MTVLSEEAAALTAVRDFLLAIGHGEYKRVSKDVRTTALRLLRHYPFEGRVAILYSARSTLKRK